MARGRMLNRRIAKSKKVNKLESYFNKLLYSWMMPFLDRDGRIEGDPELLKADIFPRDRTVTLDMIEEALKDMVKECLIVWYEDDDGEKYIQMLNFKENQIRMEYKKEAESCIPPYNKELHKNSSVVIDLVESDYRASRPEEKFNGSEEKFNGSELKEKVGNNPFRAYEPEEKNSLGTNLIQKTIEYWNSKSNIPKTKYTCLDIPKQYDIIPKFNVYSEEEIFKAIDNLDYLYLEIEAQYRTTSFSNFFANNTIDSFIEEANPHERYNKPFNDNNLTDEERRAAYRYFKAHDKTDPKTMRELREFMESESEEVEPNND